MIQNAKVVGSSIDPDSYHRREETSKRGEKEYIISRSDIVEIVRCPKRWVKGFKNKQTESMKWGSLVDTLLLDKDRVFEKYVVPPEVYTNDKGETKPWNLNAKKCKEWKENNKDKIVVKQEVIDKADDAINSVDGTSAHFIVSSEKQVMVTAEWFDEDTGIIVPLKCLIDLVPDKDHELYGQFLGDLKTVESASPNTWPRKVWQYDYHTQGAFYIDMYNEATQENRTDFAHILIESFPPYTSARRMLSFDGEMEFLDLGRNKYVEGLKLYCKCLKTGEWPDYDSDINKQYSGFSFVSPEPYMVGVYT